MLSIYSVVVLSRKSYLLYSLIDNVHNVHDTYMAYYTNIIIALLNYTFMKRILYGKKKCLLSLKSTYTNEVERTIV